MTAAPSTGLPGSSLFEVAWDDRSPFAAGLVTGQQAVLEQQPGASVYHLDVALSDDMTTVHGREEVRYTNTEDVPLDSVVFRLFPNLTGGSIAVSGLTVNGQPVEPIYSLEDSVMTVPLSEPLQPGQQAVLAMDFDVVVPTDPETSNYGTFASFDDVLALAHFYPMIAVYDDEGWNVEIAPPEGDVVYADSGYYLTRITLPDEQVLVASGVTLDESRKDGQQVVTVAAGPARDFYLAASDAYQVVSQQVGETTINSYAPRSLQRGSGEVLDIAAAAMRSYEDHVGPYPYTEMDLVSTATSALGVEYPGIMALTSRIYDGQYQQYLEATVAHEVGHQWFYNVVGDDQLDDPWLDEALTQYITLLYFQDRYGEEGYDGFHRWRAAGTVSTTRRFRLACRWLRIQRAASILAPTARSSMAAARSSSKPWRNRWGKTSSTLSCATITRPSRGISPQPKGCGRWPRNTAAATWNSFSWTGCIPSSVHQDCTAVQSNSRETVWTGLTRLTGFKISRKRR